MGSYYLLCLRGEKEGGYLREGRGVLSRSAVDYSPYFVQEETVDGGAKTPFVNSLFL